MEYQTEEKVKKEKERLKNAACPPSVLKQTLNKALFVFVY